MTTTDDGLDQAISSATEDWWFTGAMVALRQLAATGRGFTVDDLIDLTGQPADPHHVGALFAAARRSKLIDPVGARIGRDGRPCRIWWGCAQ